MSFRKRELAGGKNAKKREEKIIITTTINRNARTLNVKLMMGPARSAFVPGGGGGGRRRTMPISVSLARVVRGLDDDVMYEKHARPSAERTVVVNKTTRDGDFSRKTDGYFAFRTRHRDKRRSGSDHDARSNVTRVRF